MLGNLAIPLGLIIVWALLLWFIIGAKGQWWIKLILIMVIPSFSFAIIGALSSFDGWPTRQTPPEKFFFLWGIIDEPDPNNPGAIYIWTIPDANGEDEGFWGGIFKYRPQPYTPRAYQFSYTRNLHKQVEKAREMTKEGKRMIFRRGKHNRKPGEFDQDGNPRNNPEGEESEGRSGYSQGDEYEAYELPPPKLPAKKPPK